MVGGELHEMGTHAADVRRVRGGLILPPTVERQRDERCRLPAWPRGRSRPLSADRTALTALRRTASGTSSATEGAPPQRGHASPASRGSAARKSASPHRSQIKRDTPGVLWSTGVWGPTRRPSSLALRKSYAREGMGEHPTNETNPQRSARAAMQQTHGFVVRRRSRHRGCGRQRPVAGVPLPRPPRLPRAYVRIKCIGLSQARSNACLSPTPRWVATEQGRAEHPARSFLLLDVPLAVFGDPRDGPSFTTRNSLEFL
jgi:hypothetical protein